MFKKSMLRRQRVMAFRILRAAAVAALSVVLPTREACANTELDVANGSTDLTAAGTYGGTAPTTTSDITFTNIAYTPAAFTVGSALSIGTLNDLSPTALSISGTGLITLNGGVNTVASANGGSASDLIYVASGGSLGITNTPIALTTTAANGNFDIVGTATLGGVISGATFGFTKTGAGTLTLSGANTFTGGLGINGGIVSVGAVANLGVGPISLNGGTLRTTAVLTFAAADIITVGAAGGTLDLTSATKTLISTTGGLTGSGTFTRTASANNVLVGTTNILQISVANTGFTGAVVLNGGQNEISANGFGNGLTAGNTITINSGAELTASNGTIANALIINAGANIGGDQGTSTFSGPVTVNGAFNIRLGDFFQGTQRNLIISGPITGTGAFTLLSANSNTVGAGNSQTLFLNGNNSGYTSAIGITAGFNVSFGTVNSFGTGGVTVNSTTAALGGIGIGYDFGNTLPAFTNSIGTATTGGVFGVNTALAATTVIDLATLGGGTMFLGASNGATGTYNAATLGASAGIYRLGGGGGTIIFPNAVLTGANSLVVGDSRVNGGGTVILSAANTYTGTTTVNGGTLQVGNGGLTGSIGAGDITLGAGTLAFRRSDNVVFDNKITATAAGSTLAVNGGAVVTLTNPANTLGVITFNTTAGGVLDIGPNDIAIGTSGAGGAEIAANVNGTINATGGGRLKLNVNAGDIGAAAGATLIINPVITNGTGSSIDFFNSGVGAVVLNGANTYTGVNNIQSAVVQVSNIGSVGSASSNLGAQTTATNATLNIGGSATSTLRYVGAGETTDRVINLAGTTFGVVLDQAGTGNLKFTSPFTATGAGIKTLTLTGSTSGTGEISGAIVDNTTTNKTSVAKTGTGTWTLDGTNTYTGTTTAGGGNLILDYTAATAPANSTNLIAPTSPLTVAGGTLTVNGSASNPTSQTFASTALSGGGGGVVAINNGPGTFVALGAFTRAAGSVLNITQPSGALSATNGVTTTTGNNAAGIIGGAYTVNGVDWAVSGGSATAPITAYTGYTPLTAAGGGTATTTNFLQTDSQTLTAPITANSLKITDTATGGTLTTGANAITLNGTAGGLLYVPGAPGNAYTITGTGVVGAGTASEFFVNVATGGTLTISAPIINNALNNTANGILTKAGGGTLVLTTPSTFGGAINIEGGILQVAQVANTTTPFATLLGGPNGGTTLRAVNFNNGGTLRFTSTTQFNDNNASTTNAGFAFNIGSGGGGFDVPNGASVLMDDAGQFTGTGTLTVTGAGTGNVTINNQAYAFSGNVNVNSGTLNLGNNSVLGTTSGRSITVASGGVLNVTSSTLILPLSITLNGGSLTATAAYTITSPVTLTSDSSVGGTAALTINAPVSGGFKLTKVGTNTVTLSGVNTYTGGTAVNVGTLQVARVASLPGQTTPGSIAVAAGATLGLNVGDVGEFTAADVTNVLTNATFASNTAALRLDTTNAPGGTFTYNPAITQPISFQKSGPGTLFLGSVNTYTGTTTVLNGTLAVTSLTNNSLPQTALVLGTLNAAAVGAVDLGATSQTFTTLTAQSNSSTLVNTVTVAPGQTLTATGVVNVGYDNSANVLATATKLTIAGGGAVSFTGTSVNVGVTQGTGNAVNNSIGTLDVTAASSFTSTNTLFNVGGGNDVGGTALLSNTANTITATTLNVGNSNANNQGGNSQLTLGTGTNALNVNNLQIGTSKGNGTVSFASPTAGSPGTVTIGNAAGTGGTAITVGSNTYLPLSGAAAASTSTGAVATGTLDLRGHTATVAATTLDVGVSNNNNAGTPPGGATGSVLFDAGTFTASGAITLGSKASTGGTGTGSGTLTIAGGAFTTSGTAAFTVGTNAVATGTGTGTINLSGGSLTVGSTGAFVLGNATTAGGAASGTVNITGGTLTTAVNITRGATVGGSTATLTLNGGTLNMAGHSIGTSAAPVTYAFQSGTLDRLAELNGGAAFNKTTTGILTLTGAENYTGPTNVTGGTLVLNGTLTATAVLTVDPGATLKGQGGATNPAVAVTVNGTLSPGNSPGISPGILTIAGSLTLAAGSTYVEEIGGTTPGNAATNYDQVNSGSMTLTGGNLLVSGVNNFSTGGAVDPNPYFILTQSAPGTTAAGQFNGLGEGATVLFTDGITKAQITYLADSSTNSLTGGNDVALYNVNAVPEPAMMSLAGLATLGLARRRRRTAK